MIRLVLSDIGANTRIWLGILSVAMTTGFVAAIAAGLLETGGIYGGRIADGLASSSAAVIMFTSLTAVIVLGAAANLTVNLQRRSYALWQLVGIRPGLVELVVLMQLSLVGAVGGLLGALLALPVFSLLFRWVFRDWQVMQSVHPQLTAMTVLAVVLVVAAITVVGGLRGAVRASRTPPIEALQDPEPRQASLGWLRILLVLLVVGGTIRLALGLDGTSSISAFSGQAMLLTPLIAATLAAAGPLLLPLLLRAWTSLVPARASATWFLSRNAAAYRIGQSSAAISPLMVAIAIAGGLYTTGGTLALAQYRRTGDEGGFDLAPEGVVLLLGGPLLLSGVAAAATVFMTGLAREREFALIQAAGSSHSTIVLTAVWEACIYAVTAAILGTASVVIGGSIVATKLSLPSPVVSFSTIGLIAGGGLALILVATIVPTVAALRHEIPRTLAAG